ncbi:MAG: phosphatidylserine decarboxylase family protein [Verrucomicrobia bacterium]|nr:MAG: phosphatidylserine decarboxylase family protein [Verrucomicrobiota bacterium]
MRTSTGVSPHRLRSPRAPHSARAPPPQICSFHAATLPTKIIAVKHKGKATQAALKLIFWSLVALLVVTAVGILAALVGTFITAIAGILFAVWVLFALFCLWFFRDPNPSVPLDAQVIVAPAHGKVDMVDETEETDFMGGPCRRISIFLSVIEVHVQKAPVAGSIMHLKHTPGRFMSALKQESAAHNENLLVGFDSNEQPGEKIAVRLIAGVLARRIVPWIAPGDEVARGERISLIQFGSRVDTYLPLTTRLCVKPGDKVRGGETVIATRV